MSTWRREWVLEKCRVALNLANGAAGGGYAEAAILVSAVLSALAAELWPGLSIDGVRFVELLTTMGPEALTCRSLSVPLLLQHLTAEKSVDAIALQQVFGVTEKSLVLNGEAVDRTEQEILKACSNTSVEILRRFSYASILYSEIRSSYAHQYQPGGRADSWPMTSLKNQRVSYVNRLADTGEVHRLVHFHIEWLAALPIGIAEAIDGLSQTPARPVKWWAKGRL